MFICAQSISFSAGIFFGVRAAVTEQFRVGFLRHLQDRHRNSSRQPASNPPSLQPPQGWLHRPTGNRARGRTQHNTTLQGPLLLPNPDYYYFPQTYEIWCQPKIWDCKPKFQKRVLTSKWDFWWGTPFFVSSFSFFFFFFFFFSCNIYLFIYLAAPACGIFVAACELLAAACGI